MQVTSDKHPFTVYHQYGEIMHKPGDNNYFVGQLSKDLKYIHKTKIKSYVMRTYGLTCKEYYGIVSHNDPNWVKLCDRPGCNNVAIFGIGWGYGECCCNACHVSVTTKRKWTETEYRTKHAKVLIDNNLTGKAPNAFNKKSFLMRGKPTDICTVYIGLSGIRDSIKFGVTNKTIQERKRRNKMSTIHTVFVGTRIECAQIEFLLKRSLNTPIEWIMINRWQEVFGILKQIIRNKTYIIESSSTIETASK